MKILLFLLVGLFAAQAPAVKNIKLESIANGQQLFLNGSIELPKLHRLNKAAPSNMKVLEKEGPDWKLTEQVNLNDFFSLTEMIRFQKPIKLKSHKSEIKISMSLYHCPADHKGLCVIDDFEGVIKRDPKKVTTEVNVSLKGTDPQKY